MGKETNEARTQGIRPSKNADAIPVGKIPDQGTQVAVYDYASGTTVELHEVTTGETLYLSSAFLSARNASGGASSCEIHVTDGDNTEQYTIMLFSMADTLNEADTLNLLPPLEIPPGWKVKLKSGAANMHSYCFIHGYEA